MGGRTLFTQALTLSPDGKTMNITIKGTRPDGSAFNNQVTTRRIAGTSGFVGTWESTALKISSPMEYDIQPYQSDGLSFIVPAYSDTLSMKFDGKDYAETGPEVAPGSTSSGHRVNQYTLEVSDKVKSDVIDTAQYKVSADGKTLTLTVHEKGQSKPQTYVYERK
jgi:hypothetical protein